MHEELRRAVGKAEIPAPNQELTLTPELVKRIADICPFWPTLLKKQTIQDMKDGDAYVSGFAEMFSRIFKALPDPIVLGRLTIEDVYVVDQEIQEGGAETLAKFYPVLTGAPELGAFGGGIMLAYGMFERAISGGLPKPPKAEPPSESVAPQDIAEELEKGLDESVEVVDPGPTMKDHIDSPIAFAAVDKGDRWSVDGEFTYLSQAAKIHEFCAQVFKADPYLKVSSSGHVQFHFDIPKRS